MPRKIPPEAENEILKRLACQMRIHSDEVDTILQKYGVAGNEEQLQQSYRRQLGQRLLAGLRDEEGRREVLAVGDGKGGTEYLVVDCCNNLEQPTKIRHRLGSQTAGLDNSMEKVKNRMERLNRFARKIRKAV